MKFNKWSYVNNFSYIVDTCVLLESTIDSKIELYYLGDY